MVFVPPKIMKLMKIVHILAAQIWFGAVVCIFGFAFYCFNNTDINNFLILAPTIPRLYQMAVLPAALVCIVQGIIYGFFSKWGFVKYRWIIIKWLSLPFIVICTRIGGIGQIFTILENVQQSNAEIVTLSDGKVFFVFIILQIIILGIMTIVSIIKLKNNKKNKNDANSGVQKSVS
jgi:hypothetical protein